MSGGGAGSVTATITLLDDSYTDTRPLGFTAEATFSLKTNGIAEGGPYGTNTSYTYRDGDIAANYEVKATLTSGTFATGTAGSWLNLGTERTWTVRHSGGTEGSTATFATFEIRKVGTTDILDSADIILSAEVI